MRKSPQGELDQTAPAIAWRTAAAHERWLSCGIEIGKCNYTLTSTGSVSGVQRLYLLAKCREWFIAPPSDDSALVSAVAAQHYRMRPAL